VDGDRLRDLAAYVGGDGCVARHGAMVFTWGDPARRADIASAAKPWYAHFLFQAIEEKRIPHLEAKVSEWEPRLLALNPDLAHKDRAMTWRHLATQTSCYGVREAPGAAFDYNDWQMALFWDTLFLKVFGAAVETIDARVLRPLTEALQCQDAPSMLAFGPKDRAGRLAVSPRDFARFGLLYLRQGAWKSKRLLGEQRAREAVRSPLPNSLPRTAGEAAQMIPGQRSIGSTRVPDNQTDHFGSYSFLWWINGVDRDGRRRWPDAPRDAFGAFGHGGRRAMAVVPSLDLVVSWNNSKIQGGEMENSALQRLCAAVKELRAQSHGSHRNQAHSCPV
jgi:CubicO group peptidase (beta-lactamase class C family)